MDFKLVYHMFVVGSFALFIHFRFFSFIFRLLPVIVVFRFCVSTVIKPIQLAEPRVKTIVHNSHSVNFAFDFSLLTPLFHKKNFHSFVLTSIFVLKQISLFYGHIRRTASHPTDFFLVVCANELKMNHIKTYVFLRRLLSAYSNVAGGE